MRKLIVLLVAGLTLAVASANPGPTFTSVQVNPDPNDPDDAPEFAGEPGIAIDPTNPSTMWVVAPDGLDTLAWRSTDAGLTWTQVDPPEAESGGGDSDVAMDAAGVAYVSDLVNEAGDSTIPVWAWNGSAWNTAVPLDASASGIKYDRQWMAAQGTGHVVLIARQGNKYQFWESTNGASSFVGPTQIATDVQTGGPIAFAPNGSLYAIYTSTGGKVRLVKRPFGSAWQPPTDVFNVTTARTTADFPIIDVDDAGNVYAVWDENRGSILGFGLQSLVFVSVSTNGGTAWSPPVQVSDSSKTAIFPWVAAGAAGKVDVLFIQADDDVNPDVGTPTTRWDVRVSQSLNATASSPMYDTVIAVDDFHTGSICTKGGLCLGPQGTLGVGNAPTPLDRRHLDFFEMALDSAGKAYVSYTRDRPIVAEDNSITVGDLFLSWNDLLVARQTGGDTVA